MKIPMIKDSSGKQSASVTMMIVAFIIVSLWLVLSIFEELWGLKVRVFDPTAAMAFLSPLLALYFGRRYTDSKEASSSSSAAARAPRAAEPSDTTI